MVNRDRKKIACMIRIHNWLSVFPESIYDHNFNSQTRFQSVEKRKDNVNGSFFEAAGVEAKAKIFTDLQIKELLPELRELVIKWIHEPRPYCKGPEWKQVLKNVFVILNQFDSQNRQHWTVDIERAAKQATDQCWRKWQHDKVDTNLAKIAAEVVKLKKKSPKQDWLVEKAYCWLKSLPREILKVQDAGWYPQHAIEVAHRLFVSSGKFVTFMNYLKQPNRRRQDPIDMLIEARIPIAGTPTGLGSEQE